MTLSCESGPKTRPAPLATDDELLAAARGGDGLALTKLIERHQAQIYRFGLKMCRDPEDARDVLQETLLAMARGVHDFRGGSSLSTWLYTVARNFCIKKRRQGKRTADEASLDADGPSDAMELEDPMRPPDEALAGKEVEAAVDRAIRALDDANREVLILRDVEGLTATEVARTLGISVRAVKSRLHRARVAVRDGLSIERPGHGAAKRFAKRFESANPFQVTRL